MEKCFYFLKNFLSLHLILIKIINYAKKYAILYDKKNVICDDIKYIYKI